MKEYRQELFEGERALFASRGLKIYDSIFQNGESPLKESCDVELYGCIFKWKYPLWYCRNMSVCDSVFLETARSGIWYTDSVTVKDSVIEAPKTFRRSSNITLNNVKMPFASETLWNSKGIKLIRVNAVGDYFGMNSQDVYAEDFTIDGNYVFDGARNVEINRARLISKDAFWNAENVVVRDSLIIGEYLGWNSKNVRLINCTIESNQGLCYMENVKLEGCKLINTDLAFEYSTVEAEINSKIDSVKNPIKAKIKAHGVGTVILDEKFINPQDTEIITER